MWKDVRMMEHMAVNVSEKKRHWLAFWPLYMMIALMIVSVPFLYVYFSERVFYLDSHLYKLHESEDGVKIYRSSSGPEVSVQETDEGKIVTIEGENYVIRELINRDHHKNLNVSVIYPDGNWYRVEDGYGHLMTYDRAGEFAPMIKVYVNGERRLRSDEPLYHPESLVISAYPVYHATRGVPGLTILSYLLLILGWSTFRYEKFQTFLFHLNFYRLWVEDPEPTDFYYFMTKVSGILLMGAAVVLFFFSLSS